MGTRLFAMLVGGGSVKLTILIKHVKGHISQLVDANLLTYFVSGISLCQRCRYGLAIYTIKNPDFKAVALSPSRSQRKAASERASCTK